MKYLVKISTVIAVRLLLSFADAAESDPLAKTTEQFGAVVEQVAAANSVLNKISEQHAQLDELIRKANLPKEQKLALQERLSRLARFIDSHNEHVGQFLEKSGLVKDALSLGVDVANLKGQIEQDRENLGPLAGELTVLSEGLKQFGGKVPVVGQALAEYGEMTGALLDATRKLAGTIHERRNQDAIGAGTLNASASRAKNAALVALLGDEAKGQTWLPDEPSWLYTPAGNADESDSLIWDAAASRFHRVPRGVRASEVYRDNLLAGKALAPDHLRELCERHESARQRAAAAGSFCDLLGQMEKDYGGDGASALTDFNLTHDWQLALWLRNRAKFKARFTYDGQFKLQVLTQLGALQKELEKSGKNAKWLGELKKRLAAAGVGSGAGAAAGGFPSTMALAFGELTIPKKEKGGGGKTFTVNAPGPGQLKLSLSYVPGEKCTVRYCGDDMGYREQAVLGWAGTMVKTGSLKAGSLYAMKNGRTVFREKTEAAAAISVSGPGTVEFKCIPESTTAYKYKDGRWIDVSSDYTHNRYHKAEVTITLDFIPAGQTPKQAVPAK